MDLSFLTGNPTTQPAAMSWMTPNNAAAPTMNTPAMQYQPGMSLAGFGSNNEANSQFFTGSGQSLGMNIPTFQLGLGALGSLANIYGGFQANKLAKEQLSFTKDIANANLNNSIKSYNTALEDRARSRAVAENRDQSSADAYIEKNKLSR